MARILSIDYGKKRTGLAVTDPLQLIAGGLATVASKSLPEFLKTYMQQEKVERIIMGEPRQIDGSPSENYARVQEVLKKLRAAFPDIPIETYDERFTSVLAHQAMLTGGLKKKERQNKALVDEISATILLQSYMEAMRNKRNR
ncbi:MAG: Holliday junction resolvase RuvX [Prevotella sp.]|nr:Holliday junction resolvase RuvX [Prevotella sp.]MDY2633372.1 Holliday junction resolvase RuvX [Prevotella sp.]